MKRVATRISFLLLLSLVLLAETVWAQDPDRVFHWSGKLAPDKSLEIKDVNGTIRAEATSGEEVQVTAEKSGTRADEVKIQVVPSSEGVTICATYPSGIFGGSSSPCEPGSHWHSNNVHSDNTKVDFTVRLPKNLRFSAWNVNGNIKAEDLGRVVRANTVNGSVQVSTAQWAEAATVNGLIELTMGNAGWDGTLKIATVNGSVHLQMPSDLNAEVKFNSVNGHISSDFPVTLSGFVGHSARGTIGNGGRTLVVDTVNGSVELRKSTGGI